MFARPLAMAPVLHAPGVRGLAPGDQCLHRRLCGGVRHRSPRRWPDDVGVAGHRQLLPGRPRRAGDGTRPGARATTSRAATRVIVLSDRGWTRQFNRDPKRAGTHGARPRRAVRDRRRDAGGVPRPRGLGAGLLGAAGAAWGTSSPPIAAGKTAPASASSAASGRTCRWRRRARRLRRGTPTARPKRADRRARRPSCWCRGAARFRSPWKPSRSSRRCSSPSG